MDGGGGGGGRGHGRGGSVSGKDGHEGGGQGGWEGGGRMVLIFDSLLISLHFSQAIILTINVRLPRTSTLSLIHCNFRCNPTPIDS